MPLASPVEFNQFSGISMICRKNRLQDTSRTRKSQVGHQETCARRYGAGETTDSDLVPLMAGMKEKVKRTSRKPMNTWKNWGNLSWSFSFQWSFTLPANRMWRNVPPKTLTSSQQHTKKMQKACWSLNLEMSQLPPLACCHGESREKKNLRWIFPAM